ncbi:classical arabinogalactan protein 9-like [Neltuma alba]|uniref:classical arabinogalactan protein 9-like n=1 Tax=Neltuma alba TaxID=207710 RepID=UPI0010A2F407|nr:classical arabinogalactan protein 9-like [Prosopis alba]
MESFQPRWFLLVVAMVAVMAAPARGQISTPCNASILNTFTPCMNYLTNSSAGGGSSAPTTQCCDSLKTLTSGSMDCLCLVVTGSVPFQLPINRTLAISLPRACRMPRIPVQCKASGSPLPAPAPSSLGPSASPASAPSGFTSSPSPQVSSIPPSTPTTPSEAPESDTTPPSSPVDNTNTPPSSTAGRTDLTPSSAISSSTFSPASFLLIASALVGLLNCY